MSKLTPMKAIRKKCLDCSGTSNEVKLCDIVQCPLYIYRSGHRPKIEPEVEDDEEDNDEPEAEEIEDAEE